MSVAPYFLCIAAALAGAGVAEGENMARPLWLDAKSTGEANILRLRGSSAVPCSARYELEINTGPDGHSNRSVHRGVARLRPGPSITIVNLKFSNSDDNNLSARLAVESCNNSQYEEILTLPINHGNDKRLKTGLRSSSPQGNLA